MQYTLYTYAIQYTLKNIHYTLYTLHFTLYTIHYTLYTIHYTLYSFHLPLLGPEERCGGHWVHHRLLLALPLLPLLLPLLPTWGFLLFIQGDDDGLLGK